MKTVTFVKKSLPQNPDIEVLVPNYKEPILAVNRRGFGWYGLQAFNEQGQLMCHECGRFYEELSRHIKRHKLSSEDYKIKYGLLQTTKLVTIKAAQKYRDFILNDHKVYLATVRRLDKIRPPRNDNNRPKGTGNRILEYQNRFDTCKAQLIRCLFEASKVYGENITQSQAEQFRCGLVSLLCRNFGTFNKAKQLVRLIVNPAHGKAFPKQFILENMCVFYSQHGRWPKQNDYSNGLMICKSPNTLSRNGGITALRQEAMKLREEQEERRVKGEQVVQYANKIEFENAGRAMR